MNVQVGPIYPIYATRGYGWSKLGDEQELSQHITGTMATTFVDAEGKTFVLETVAVEWERVPDSDDEWDIEAIRVEANY